MTARLWIVCVAFAAAASAQPAGQPSIPRLIALGDSLTRAASFDSAIAVHEEALRLAEARGGAVDTTVARVLIKLAIANFYKARFGECKKLWTRALDIRREILGPDHPETAAAMTYLGILYDEMGMPSQAVPVFEEALGIYDRSPQADPSKVADCVNNLAISYLKLGRLEESEKEFQRALKLYETHQGPDDPDVGGCLSNLGLIHLENGDYASALPLFRRALEIQEKSRGKTHPDVAQTVWNIANVYVALGRYDEAERYFQRALDIKKTTLGPRHPEVANVMGDLANSYIGQQRYDDAEPLLVEAREILEAAYGPDHIDLAGILANLGRVRGHQDRFDDAEKCFRRALEIREKKLGPFHPKVAGTLTNLSILYYEHDRYAEALDCNLRALEINENVLGAKHPWVANGLDNTATLYRLEGRYEEALSMAGRACKIRQENLVQNGRALTERDALAYAGELAESISKLLSTFLEAPQSDQTTMVVEALLRGKGQVTDVMAQRTRSLVTETDPETRGLANSLYEDKKNLSDLFVRGPGDNVGKYRNSIRSLTRAIELAEATLAEKSASFREWRDWNDVTVARIKERLPENAALVEYVFYQHVRLAPDSILPAYAAVVIRRDKAPVVVDLGDATEIDALVESYRDHFREIADLGAPTRGDVDRYRAVAAGLYEMLWRPVDGLLGGPQLVLICPDAGLNLVSFAALPVPRAGYLIERYAVHYLSSARDLLRFSDERATASTGLLALGDPDYETPDDTSGSPSRGALPGCDDFWNTFVGPLPGTRREVEQIVAAWNDAGGETAKVLLGADATEEAFKNAASAARVLHLATHGYYVGGACGRTGETSGLLVNPMLLSGLFLAGANRRSRDAGQSAREDGVLTALEVSSLDLAGCDLVVLSACETGLGDPRAGEGVFGLRRAFHLAGARTVVSALWSVSDRDAARFASRLYAHDDHELPYRLRDLMRSLLEDLRRDDRADHPFGWAAFVAQGDWRR